MKTTPIEEVFKKLPKHVMRKAEARYQVLRRELLLGELRESLNLTQAQVAKASGIKTPNLSRLERQKNMKVDTLRKVVAALGGRLEIVARFKDEDVTILTAA